MLVADFALVHPPMASLLLSASVERCFVSRMQDFFLMFNEKPCFNQQQNLKGNKIRNDIYFLSTCYAM